MTPMPLHRWLLPFYESLTVIDAAAVTAVRTRSETHYIAPVPLSGIGSYAAGIAHRLKASQEIDHGRINFLRSFLLSPVPALGKHHRLA